MQNSSVSRHYSTCEKTKRIIASGKCKYCGKKKEKKRQDNLLCGDCADKANQQGRERTLRKRERLGKGPIPVFVNYSLAKKGSQCPHCKYKAGNTCTIYGYDTNNVKYPCEHKE